MASVADQSEASQAPQRPKPASGQQQHGEQGEGRSKSNFVGAVSNFNIQYNLTSASMAVQIISSDVYLGHPLYPQPVWSKDLALAVVFVGTMIGMLVMGRLGDIIGRCKALRITTVLAILGATVPALAGGDPQLAYGVICVGRLLLGIGLGGIYPLSAVSAAESSESSSGRSSRIGWAFFWQTPGAMVPYLVALVLFVISQSAFTVASWVPQVQFRFLFALGVLPGSVVLLASMKETESEEFRSSRAAAEGHQDNSESILAALMRESPETRRTLLGTSGAWFFYDVAYYGTSVFTPLILGDICLAGTKVHGVCHQTLIQTSWQSLVVLAWGIPGALLAVCTVDRHGCRRLNILGFVLQALNFLVMGLVSALSAGSTKVLFVLLCLLMCLLNFGPNLGTFVLPAVCFPVRIRSTCHGISAFGGKFGAVVGTILFPLVNASPVGLPGVLFIQFVCCLLGAACSVFLLKDDWKYTEAQATSNSFLENEHT